MLMQERGSIRAYADGSLIIGAVLVADDGKTIAFPARGTDYEQRTAVVEMAYDAARHGCIDSDVWVYSRRLHGWLAGVRILNQERQNIA